MISQRTIEEIKERASLLDVAGEFVKLHRQGSGYSGLCPFHSERSPSFHVRDNGRFYHCFGCGASGNVISFLMEARGLAFREAIEDLASRFGISIIEEGNRPKPQGGGADAREALFTLNALAHRYFTENFKRAGREITGYLSERGVSKRAIEEFEVGFAPPERAGLYHFLKGAKISEQRILESGLVRRNQNGELYDTFRARIVFPIFVERKQIAGFGGRIIPSLVSEERRSSVPKYLNSPETPVYQKSKILFGLPQALAAIRQTKTAYLVEGYLDVIGLWQAGVHNAMATCGTAVTEEHVKRLSHLANRVVLLFDGDDAGQGAAGKSFPIFLNSGIDTEVVFLPDGEDPDTVALAHGTETASYLKRLPSKDLLTCFVEYTANRLGHTEVRRLGAAAKGKVAVEVAAVLGKVKNSVEQSELTDRAAQRLGIEHETFASLVRGKEAQILEKIPPVTAPQTHRSISDLPATDREILRVVMARKRQGTQAVLSDGDLCSAMDPTTLDFVQELDELYAIEGLSEAEMKIRVREILARYGESWKQHWKDSYRMGEGAEVNFDEMLKGCRRMVQKNKMTQAIRAIDEELRFTEDEGQKGKLSAERIELERKLRTIHG